MTRAPQKSLLSEMKSEAVLHTNRMNLSLALYYWLLSTKITVSSGLSKIFVQSSGLFLYRPLDPFGVVWNFCVDPVLALTSTALPKAGDPVHHPDVVLLAEQRSSTVPSARVYPTAAVTSAKHVLCDVIVLVHAHTVAHWYNGHLTKIKVNTRASDFECLVTKQRIISLPTRAS